MKLIKPMILVAGALLLGGCATSKITYPSSQLSEVDVKNRQSIATVAKSAHDFTDSDIAVPAYFDTQGIDKCTFDENESDRCPLKKSIIRVYFEGNQVNGKGLDVSALKAIDNVRLVKMFENQVAGLNRFRILTRDNEVAELERQTQLMQQGASKVSKRAAAKRILQPDYIIKIDTVKTSDTFYGEYNGSAQYTLEITSSILDPYTQEKLSQPNIGKIRVKAEDVRSRDDLIFVEVSGRYYTGFDYTDENNVHSVMNDMASRGFDIFITRLLTEMPSTAQVMGIKGDQITLDRGANAGVLPGETMIVFGYEAGFVEPIGVAIVNPSANSGNGSIVRWKNNDYSDGIRGKAKNGIYRPANGTKIFAVSVGAPVDFIKSRT